MYHNVMKVYAEKRAKSNYIHLYKFLVHIFALCCLFFFFFFFFFFFCFLFFGFIFFLFFCCCFFARNIEYEVFFVDVMIKMHLLK